MLKLPNNQKIHFYNLGWYGYEGSGSIYLAHTTKYTVKQWEDMLKEATVVVAKAKHNKNHKQHCEYHNLPKNWSPMTKDELVALWDQTKDKYDGDIYEFAWRVTYSENVYNSLAWDDLYEDVAKYLVKHYGFSIVKAPRKFSFFAFEHEDLAIAHDYTEERSGWHRSTHPLFRVLNELVCEKVVTKKSGRRMGRREVYSEDILERMGYDNIEIEAIRKTHYNKQEAARKATMTPEELQVTDEMEEALLAAFASSELENAETTTEI